MLIEVVSVSYHTYKTNKTLHHRQEQSKTSNMQTFTRLPLFSEAELWWLFAGLPRSPAKLPTSHRSRHGGAAAAAATLLRVCGGSPRRRRLRGARRRERGTRTHVSDHKWQPLDVRLNRRRKEEGDYIFLLLLFSLWQCVGRSPRKSYTVESL